MVAAEDILDRLSRRTSCDSVPFAQIKVEHEIAKKFADQSLKQDRFVSRVMSEPKYPDNLKPVV